MTEHELRTLLLGEQDHELFDQASMLSREVFGPDVTFCGNVEYSNFCNQRCRYCGLRAQNSSLTRYRMTPDEFMACVSLAPELGIGTVLLQSGVDPRCDATIVSEMIQALRQLHPLSVFLSLGERSEEELRQWKECGADGYLLSLTTTDPDLHAVQRPGKQVQCRVDTLEHLQRLGYTVGSGIIVDLPGMSLDVLARDILFLSSLHLDMLVVTPFVPHPDTPLGGAPAGSLRRCLRVLALLRILNPRAFIPATAALDAVTPGGRKQGLMAGCNMFMLSLSPEPLRKGYAVIPYSDLGSRRHAVARFKDWISESGLSPSATPVSRPGMDTPERPSPSSA
jgi:biotin synthase